MCSGDSNLILDGIHENVLQLNYHDPVMQKTVSIYHTPTDFLGFVHLFF